MIKAFHVSCFLLLIFKANFSFAQIAPAQPQDSLREIRIIFAKTFREKTVDSVTSLKILVGSVALQQGTTKFNCDSAIINQHLNTMEAFGNVRINQADTIFTTSQYIKYLGNERLATLKKNVKLSDKKGTLTTQELEYNMLTGIGKYTTGGKVTNGKTILTSKEGTYYEDTKDVIFKTNVDVNDPSAKIKADSLLYNMQSQGLTFTGPTYIKNKSGNIYTTQGNYDLKTGNAQFTNRSIVKDSSGRVYQANDMAIDQKTGVVQMEGNAIIKDSANSSILTGNEIFMDQKKNSALATKKPVFISWQKKDTTYISGDTLFSGTAKRVSSDAINTEADSSETTKNNLSDSIKIIPKKDSINIKLNLKPLKKIKADSANNKDSLVRYFIAYHHVKIFNDSLQSVCDSMFYSSADSVFRLFQNPVIWNGNSQLAGDTIYMFTKNNKPQRLYVFNNGTMINKANKDFYNQISGRTINGYFKEGEIDYTRVKGSPAESIYFLQDQKDSSFSGMNRANGSVIDMFFIKQQLNQVKFLNDVHGKLYPMRHIPEDQKRLKNFNWLDKRRPKNKLELFE